MYKRQIQSLYLALEKGVDCEILDEHNRIRLIQGEYRIKKAEQYGKYVSLIPFTTDVNGVTLEGLKYPVQNLSLIHIYPVHAKTYYPVRR